MKSFIFLFVAALLGASQAFAVKPAFDCLGKEGIDEKAPITLVVEAPKETVESIVEELRQTTLIKVVRIHDMDFYQNIKLNVVKKRGLSMSQLNKRVKSEILAILEAHLENPEEYSLGCNGMATRPGDDIVSATDEEGNVEVLRRPKRKAFN